MKRFLLILLLFAGILKGYSQAVTTNAATTISTNQARLYGNVTSIGTGTHKGFVYSIYSVNSNPTFGGTGVTAVPATLPTIGTTGTYNTYASSLTDNTLYTYKAFIRSGVSPNFTYTYGSSVQFTTKAQAYNITFDAVTANTFTINWARGSYDGCIVVISEAEITSLPTTGAGYDANPDLSTGLASDLGGGAYVVYDGVDATVDISGLTAGTTYHVRIFEYSGTYNYYTTTNATNPSWQITTGAPSLQATGLTFSSTTVTSMTVSCTRGNGEYVLILAKEGSSISIDPTDGETYTASTIYGSGSQIDGATVVYVGTNNPPSINVTGLKHSTNYTFRAYEFNSAGSPLYNVSAPSGNPATKSTIIIKKASNIGFSAVGSGQMTLTWTNGSGDERIVVAHEDALVNADPANGHTYSANTSYFLGEEIGTGNYVVYRGSSNSTTVFNLKGMTTYHYEVFESVGSGANIVYQTVDTTGNPSYYATTAKAAPTNQDYALGISSITGTSFTANWVNGNGDYRIVVVRLTSTANVLPTNGVNYTANTVFGTGGTTGTGNFVVYNGNAPITLNVTGLSASTPYTVIVYGYNNTGVSIVYKTTISVGDNSEAFATAGPAVWTGNTSTNWNTATNWDILEVPNSTRNITIPSGGNQPIIATAETHTINNLTVNAGASLTINGTGDLNVLGAALLKTPTSDGAAGQIVVTDNNGHFDVSGSSTMERYYPNPNNTYWRDVSSPETTPEIADWAGFFANRWDAANQEWVTLTDAYSMSVLQGITIRDGLSASVSFVGPFNNGPKSIGVTGSSTDGSGWNLVGNPYPSAIDWGASSGIDKSDIQSAAYVYPTGGPSYNLCSPCIIAAGQGFWVHSSVITGTPTLDLDNGCRVANSQSLLKNSEIELPKITLQAKNHFYTKETYIGFDPEASSDYDQNYDAYMLMSPNDTVADVYTFISSGSKMMLNTFNSEILNNLSAQGLVIPIGLTPGRMGSIELSAAEISNISESIFVYLYDKLENKYVDLRESSFEFDIVTKTDDRFELLLSNKAVDVKQKRDSNKDILIYTYKNSAFVKSNLFTLNNANIYVYDIMGKLIVTKPTKNANAHEIKINKPGTYIIKVISNKTVVTQKVVVQ